MKTVVIARPGGVGERLAQLLRQAGESVTLVSDPPAVARAMRETAPEAVVLESAHGADMSKLGAQILRQRPGCKIVVVAAAEGSVPALQVREQDLIALLGREAPSAGATDERRKIRAVLQTLDVTVALIESGDPYFAGFSHRVAELSREIALGLSLGDDLVDEVTIGALVRDLGKVGIGPDLLQDSGAFDAAAAARMRGHVDWSDRLIAHIDFPWRIRAVVHHHHERYDGTGYPDRRSGRAIPVGARIIAAAEAYVAMLSHRRHRPARTVDDARAEMLRESGKQFDPEIVEVLLSVARTWTTTGAEGGRPKVACVSEDPFLLRLLGLRLGEEGLDVVVRETLEETSALVAAEPFAALVVDLGRKGPEALASIRGQAATAGELPLALVALIESDDRTIRQACLGRGADDVVSRASDLEEIVFRVKNLLGRARRRAPGRDDPHGEGLSGQLETMSLADITQVLSLGQKTARVTVTGGGETGEVWFENGAAVDAKTGTLTGEPAFLRMLEWTAGGFCIHHGLRATARTIQNDTLAIVLESLQRREEPSPGRV